MLEPDRLKLLALLEQFVAWDRELERENERLMGTPGWNGHHRCAATELTDWLREKNPKLTTCIDALRCGLESLTMGDRNG